MGVLFGINERLFDDLGADRRKGYLHSEDTLFLFSDNNNGYLKVHFNISILPRIHNLKIFYDCYCEKNTFSMTNHTFFLKSNEIFVKKMSKNYLLEKNMLL